MRRYLFLTIALAGLLATLSQQLGQAQDNASRTITVKMNYTGTGTVDEKHKIYVAVWSSPEFMSGSAIPISGGATSSKNGTVTISDVTTSPVYVSAGYDPSGNWDGQSGPPPSGSSLGIYSKTPGKPEPIEVAGGKTAEVTLSFDDSTKMP